MFHFHRSLRDVSKAHCGLSHRSWQWMLPHRAAFLKPGFLLRQSYSEANTLQVGDHVWNLLWTQPSTPGGSSLRKCYPHVSCFM